MSKYREIGPDIVRIVAFMSVPAIHFFLNSGFYSAPVSGFKMYEMVIVRTLFMICVPLFLLLSGYLLSRKEIPLEKKAIVSYYARLQKILITYIIATIGIILFKQFYIHESIGIKQGILNILGYNQYSWYINMYIGLFLISPFLNAIWRMINKKENARFLVIVLAFLTVIPSILNIYDLNTPGALLRPGLSNTYNTIVPSWWQSVYPVTYYYIGAYINKYVNVKQLKIWKLIILLIVAVIGFGIFNTWRSYSVIFMFGPWCDWGGFQNTIDSVIVFLLIYRFVNAFV